MKENEDRKFRNFKDVESVIQTDGEYSSKSHQ